MLAALVFVLSISGCSRYDYKDSQIRIRNYHKIEVSVEEPGTPTEEEVDVRIQEIREAHRDITPVFRAAGEGDIVTLDYRETVDGKVIAEESGYQAELGSGQYINDFENSLIGHIAGEEYQWEGELPDDYGVSGKKAVFHIKVTQVGEATVPEFTDAFVQSISESSKTIAEYRKEVKKALKKEAKGKALEEAGYEAFRQVMEQTEVLQYPEKKLKKAKEKIESQYKDAAELCGTDYDAYVRDVLGYDPAEFDKEMEESAKAQVKEALVVDAIARQEKILQSEKEQEEALEELAGRLGYPDVETFLQDVEEKDALLVAKAERVRTWLVIDRK